MNKLNGIGNATFKKLIEFAENNQVVKSLKKDGSVLFLLPYDSDRYLVVIENGNLCQRFAAKHLIAMNENSNVSLSQLPEFVFDYEH